MKAHGMGFAAPGGVHLVRTVHHATNGRMIALNRMIVHVDADREETEG